MRPAQRAPPVLPSMLYDNTLALTRQQQFLVLLTESEAYVYVEFSDLNQSQYTHSD